MADIVLHDRCSHQPPGVRGEDSHSRKKKGEVEVPAELRDANRIAMQCRSARSRKNSRRAMFRPWNHDLRKYAAANAMHSEARSANVLGSGTAALCTLPELQDARIEP